MNATSSRGLFLICAIFAVGLGTCDSDGWGIFGPKEIEVTVDGTVTSQEIKTPVEGVSVKVFPRTGDNAYDSTTTAEDGSYKLSFSDDRSKAPSELRLEVDSESFWKVADTVTFDSTVNRDFEVTEFYVPPKQPDLSLEGEKVTAWSTSYKGVIRRYERLRASHPTYIRKMTLGKGTDSVSVYAYHFEPKTYQNTLIVSAGLHGNERLGVWALFLFLRHLSEEGKELPSLRSLRTNTRLVVVPVANPTGFTDTTRQNRNGVDLNRNFGYRWEKYIPNEDSAFGHDYKGIEPNSEPETKLLVQLFKDYSSAIAYIDIHNFFRSFGKSDKYWAWYLPKSSPNEDIIFNQIVERFQEEGQVVFSRKDNKPSAYNYMANKHDVHSSNPEFSLALFGDERHDSADMTAAVRWYGNIIVGHAEFFQVLPKSLRIRPGGVGNIALMRGPGGLGPRH